MGSMTGFKNVKSIEACWMLTPTMNTGPASFFWVKRSVSVTCTRINNEAGLLSPLQNFAVLEILNIDNQVMFKKSCRSYFVR